MLKQTFKKIGNSIVEKFRATPKLNIFEDRTEINELENKLNSKGIQLPEAPQGNGLNVYNNQIYKEQLNTLLKEYETNKPEVSVSDFTKNSDERLEKSKKLLAESKEFLNKVKQDQLEYDKKQLALSLMSPQEKEMLNKFNTKDKVIKQTIETKLKNELEENQRQEKLMAKISSYRKPHMSLDNPNYFITGQDLSQGEDVITAKMKLLDAQQEYDKSKQNWFTTVETVEDKTGIFQGEVFYNVKSNYYICHGDNETFLCNGNDKFGRVFHKLIERIGNGEPNPNVIIVGHRDGVKNISKEAFISIITNKPSYEDLTKVYALYRQDYMTINTNVVTPLY